MNVRILIGVLAAALLSIGTAQANTYTLGNLGPTPSGVTDRTVAGGATLDDLFTFNLLASPLSSWVSTVEVSPVIGFSSFSAMLYSGSTGTGTGQSLGPGGNQISLTPGAYSIRVLGQADSSVVFGAYSLGISAPVPEPHEWAMMLAGLGIVGSAAGRRRKASDVAPAAA